MTQAPRVPLQAHPVQPALNGGQQGLQQVALEPGQERLGLGIAEAAVELDHFRAVGRDHQPGVQDAPVRPPLARHRLHRGFQDLLLHLLEAAARDHRRRGVRPHSPGVGPPVPVVGGLVVLGGFHRQGALPVYKGQHAGLFALQELLDHHPFPGVAEDPLLHHARDGRERLVDAWRRRSPLFPLQGPPP